MQANVCARSPVSACESPSTSLPKPDQAPKSSSRRASWPLGWRSHSGVKGTFRPSSELPEHHCGLARDQAGGVPVGGDLFTEVIWEPALEVRGGVSPLVVSRPVDPDNETARLAGYTGTMVLYLIVDSNGEVRDIQRVPDCRT